MFAIPSIDYGIVPNPSVPEDVTLPEEHVHTSQVMMQAFATEVFRYLANCGSKIRTLVMLPESIGNIERPSRDQNGHRWPRYLYTCGWIRAASREEHIVAVPAHYSDFHFPARRMI
jgi:hypothetical protein